MKIEIGKYRLNSDSLCYWIDEKKKGDKAKEEYWERITGYYKDFDALMDNFICCKVRKSGATDMKDAVKDIDNAVKEARKIVREYVKAKVKG